MSASVRSARRSPVNSASDVASAQVRIVGGRPGRFAGGRPAWRVWTIGSYAARPVRTAAPGGVAVAPWPVGQETEGRFHKPQPKPPAGPLGGGGAALQITPAPAD